MLDLLIDGLIAEVIGEGIDISKDAIEKAVKDQKQKNMHTEIYRVIVETLNDITCNSYKNNQDKIYEAAEILLKGFNSTSGKDKIDIIKICLEYVCSNVDYDKCNEYIEKINHKISKEKHSELYRELQLKDTSRIEQKVDQVNQKLDDGNQKLDYLISEHKESVITPNKQFQNNKKQDYIDNWNGRLFLHQDNDENPLTLKDTFIMPVYKRYQINSSTRVLCCEGDSQNNTLDELINKFMVYNKTTTMLISGVPGIGKSSVTSWLANRYKEESSVIVLRFRDWDVEELEKGLLKSICNTLECNKENLEYIILILDGFDEMKILNIREKLLSNFFMDIKDLTNFKCIITSRPGYINSNIFDYIIELKEFDINMVEKFYMKITGTPLLEKEKIHSNLEVLGIPVILYMSIMSGVNISENPTKPELYYRIFAEKGGIFDKFNYNGLAYDSGVQILRGSENIKIYLEFLRKVSFKMFEKNTLSLPRTKCHIPKLVFQGKNISILEFPIKHMFENINFNIEFIHNSIYDYFVAEYIFIKILNIITVKIENKKIAGVLGKLFKNNVLTPEILEFLHYRIKNSVLNKKSKIVKETFRLMLQDGMTYYTGKSYKNVIECEMRVFANMLKIIKLINDNFLDIGFEISNYLKHNKCIDLNLEETKLSYLDLKGVKLINAQLENSKLNGVDLSEANLSGANLILVDLREADLCMADLSGANLSGADLYMADLSGANLSGADLSYASLNGTNLIQTNLSGANLEGTFWERGDVFNMLLQLKETHFEHITICVGGSFNEVHRNELFPDEK